MQALFQRLRAPHGNALFIILVAVALLAALSFAVTNTGRGGKDATKEKASLAAAQIIQNATLLEQTITRLMLTGCGEGEISFNNPVTGVYPATAPFPAGCRPYHASGGGLSYPPQLPNVVPFTAADLTWIFGARLTFPDTPTAAPDLYAFLTVADAETCGAINMIEHGTSAITTQALNLNNKFVGAYGSPSAFAFTACWAPLTQCTSLCLKSTSTNEYYYYHVILAR